ncbi:MAG: restriction endonuclease subunit S [Chromatiaceae bacterium]|nr:restriction endonuclease subunit S [Chromatiaceae bacterium]
MKTVELRAVAHIISGQHILETDHNQDGRGIGYLTGPADFGVKHPCVTRWTEKPRAICEHGDILITVKGAGVGKINAAPSDAVAISRQLMAIRSHREQLDRDYLYCFLLTRLEHFRKKAVGATVPGLSREDLETLQIRLPTINAQQSAAKEVNAQLTTVEEARQAAKAQLRELTHLANAIIRETLAHPDTVTHPLGEVLEEVKQGIGSRWAEFPVLGTTRDGLAPAKEPVGKKPERYKPVQVGTVFYNPMRILIGSIAMVDEGDAPGITSPDYVALRGRKGLVDSRWLYYWLRSPEGERCIASLARGAVRERMLFNRLAEGAIKLPPYRVQQFASQALSELRPMRQSIEAQLRDIELLPSRLLARIFDSIEGTPDARPVY